ncbi:hypothetical protein FACS189483_07750 [Spirochaetia bacterium]|nr:hypothetical protein FACS189483_07750 [Spirochaetia bacterium]
MPQIRIGTSGYSYTGWVGPVYPPGTKQRDYLSLYAELFSTVELNFAYYQMPKAAQLARMLKTAGPNLTFSIKAHQTLTHKIDPAGWEAEAETYLSALEPLQRDKRLDAVLFQFPFSFHYEPQNRRYLDKLLAFFKEVPTAVEFRGEDWYNGRVIGALKDRGVALAALDMPALPGLPPGGADVPPADTGTVPLAYIRFHGRNAGAWWGSDSDARYDYRYSDTELEAWANRITWIAVRADKILVYFNNHPCGQAVMNAQTLMGMLEGSTPAVNKK